MTTTTTETKVCKGCAEAMPLTEFRLRRRDGEDRMNLCRLCHNDRERERRQSERERRQDEERELMLRVGKNFIRALLRREGNHDDLIASSVRQIGSGKKLAQAIADYVRVAPQKVKFRYAMWMLDWVRKREQRR